MPESLMMNDYDQQDAQEYFAFITDKMENNLRKLQGLSEVHERVMDMVSDNDSASLHAPERSLHPLQGELAQRVCCTRCKVGVNSLSMSHFNFLTLNLERNPYYTLDSLFDEYTKLEEIENVHCDKCTVLQARNMTSELLRAVVALPDESMDEVVKATLIHRLESIEKTLSENDFSESALAELKITPSEKLESKKTKQVIISKPSECLTLHFNRSLYDGRTGLLEKNYAKVGLPNILDISQWCLGAPRERGPNESILQRSSTDEAGNSILYRLDAVILHRGNHESGHYITYRKIHPSADQSTEATSTDDGKTWWEISDTHVRKVKPNVMDSRGEIYMAFYSLIDQDAEALHGNAVQQVITINDDDTPTNSSTDEDTGIMTPPSDSERTGLCGLPLTIGKSLRKRTRGTNANHGYDHRIAKR